MVPDLSFQVWYNVRVINISDDNAQFNQEINEEKVDSELDHPSIIHPHVGHHGKNFA